MQTGWSLAEEYNYTLDAFEGYNESGRMLCKVSFFPDRGAPPRYRGPLKRASLFNSNSAGKF